MPKVREDEYIFGSVGVFPPTEPMHLISALSLWGHTSNKIAEEFVNSSIPTSESPKTYEHAHWARCSQLPQLVLHSKLLEEQGTWVTPSQEVQAIKVFTMGPDNAPTKWIW
jgi:hypothetical protein